MTAVYYMGLILVLVAIGVYGYVHLSYKQGSSSYKRIKYLEDSIEKDLYAFKQTGRCTNKKIKQSSQKLKKREHKLALLTYLLDKVEENQDNVVWIRQSEIVAPFIRSSSNKEFNKLFKLQCIEKFGSFEDQVYIESLAYDDSLYIRISRLKALAAIGATEALLKGIKQLKIEEPTMDDKILIECLLNYKGENVAFTKEMILQLENQDKQLSPIMIAYFTLKEEAAVARLVEMYLVSNSSTIQLKCLCILYFEKVISKSAEDHLIAHLAHEHEAIRKLSAKALKYYQDSKSMLALKKAIDDPSYKVRESAAKSFYYRMNQKQSLIKEHQVTIQNLLEAVLIDEAQLKAYIMTEETRKSEEELERYRQFLLEQIS